MEPLISTNECCTLVDQQLKLDKKMHIDPNYSNPFQAMNVLIDEFSTSSHHPVSITPTINVIIQKDKTKSELMQYFHGCLLSPVQSTLTKAIKSGFLSSFPGLDISLLKHLPKVQLRQKATSNKNLKIFNLLHIKNA